MMKVWKRKALRKPKVNQSADTTKQPPTLEKLATALKKQTFKGLRLC